MVTLDLAVSEPEGGFATWDLRPAWLRKLTSLAVRE